MDQLQKWGTTLEHETGLKLPPALSPFKAALFLPTVRVPRHFPFASLKYFTNPPPLPASPVFGRQKPHFCPCFRSPLFPAHSGSSPFLCPSFPLHVEDFCVGILHHSPFYLPDWKHSILCNCALEVKFSFSINLPAAFPSLLSPVGGVIPVESVLRKNNFGLSTVATTMLYQYQ